MKSKKINYIILLIFTVIVLYFSLKDNFNEVTTYIFKMNPMWFIISILLMVIYWIFKSLITFSYVRYYKKDYKFRSAFRLQLETMFFNGITPFSSGGGPFQVLSLKKDGVRIINSTNIMVISSFLHQLSLFTFMTISMIINSFYKLFPYNNTIRYLSIFGYIICLLFMLFLLLIMFNEKFNEKVLYLVIKILSKLKIVKDKKTAIEKWKNYIDSLNAGSRIIRSDRKTFFICALYNIIAMAAYIMVAYAVANGMSMHVDLIKVVVTTSYVLMIGMFVPIPGGTGGLEYSFTNLYSNFMPSTLVNSIMLVWRFITYYLGIVLGGIVLNLKKRSM